MCETFIMKRLMHLNERQNVKQSELFPEKVIQPNNILKSSYILTQVYIKYAVS